MSVVVLGLLCTAAAFVVFGLLILAGSRLSTGGRLPPGPAAGLRRTRRPGQCSAA
ncbi:MAG: hypothetical protein ACRDK0_10545 [Solirubrobacteraceae bacterium]